MKQQIFFSFLLASATLTCHAQDIDQEATLQEVEIQGARVVNKVDGKLYYSTEQQKNASATGYDILQRLSLPNILVNETTRTVSTLNNKGEVQLRINDIKVSKAEMLALDPKDISRIDFIDNPGVRYGEGIAYVINIMTRRNDSGHTLGTNLSQALTAAKGDYAVFGKWNKGNSELSLNYDFDYKDFKGNRTEETADYTLNDGSTHTIVRNDKASRSRDFDNSVQLKYNLADSATYVFQATLETAFSNTPANYNQKDIIDGTTHYTAIQRNKTHDFAPSLDLYFHRQITPQQSFTLNAVGTYIGTSSTNSYDEGTPYQYAVDGKTYSLMSEAIYENKLKPFTLSAGINHKLKYTRNEYTGDAASLNNMHSQSLYAFAQIRGRMSRLGYALGIGMTNLRYRQQQYRYNFFVFRPKASLTYDLTSALQLNYTFEMDSHVSRIAMISDATIRNNSMEWTLGNPDLRPNRKIEHTLRLSYDKPRWSSYIEGVYRQHPHPNMAVYERTDDDRFIYTQRNQKAIDFIYLSAYANYWLIPQKLTLMAYGGINRCMNFGDDYTHCLTSWDCTLSATAYLGSLTLSAYTNNGWRFIEGETKGRNASYTALRATYNLQQWQFSLTWAYPFNGSCKQYKSEILSRYLHKKTTLYSQDLSNYLSLTIAYRINKGRKYHEIERTIKQKDSETGIIK